jgi:hypothetical protein
MEELNELYSRKSAAKSLAYAIVLLGMIGIMLTLLLCVIF